MARTIIQTGAIFTKNRKDSQNHPREKGICLPELTNAVVQVGNSFVNKDCHLCLLHEQEQDKKKFQNLTDLTNHLPTHDVAVQTDSINNFPECPKCSMDQNSSSSSTQAFSNNQNETDILSTGQLNNINSPKSLLPVSKLSSPQHDFHKDNFCNVNCWECKNSFRIYVDYLRMMFMIQISEKLFSFAINADNHMIAHYQIKREMLNLLGIENAPFVPYSLLHIDVQKALLERISWNLESVTSNESILQFLLISNYCNSWAMYAENVFNKLLFDTREY